MIDIFLNITPSSQEKCERSEYFVRWSYLLGYFPYSNEAILMPVDISVIPAALLISVVTHDWSCCFAMRSPNRLNTLYTTISANKQDAPISSIWNSTGFDGSMNCGSSAVKYISAFGLASWTTNPCEKSFFRVLSFLSAESLITPDLLNRAEIPR